MSTLFGEGSQFKKLITWVSAILLLLPTIAYSTVEVAEAATYNNADKYSNVDPSVPLKTTSRNPDNIVGLSMTEKKGIPILRMNISATSNDVIKKGDQLNIKFDKKNVDINKIKKLAAQKNNSLYDITNKGNDLVVNFKKDATSGNYQEVFAIATKNVKADTKASATFAGKSIKIDNNNINSNYRAPEKRQSTNQPQKTANQNNSQSNSQQASTQSASSNDGESQTTTSNGQRTSQQTQANQTTSQNSETTQQQSNQSDKVSPSFSQAEDAVNSRTTIQVTGTANSVDQTQTSENTTDSQTTNNESAVDTNNGSQATSTETSQNVASDSTASQSETEQPAATNNVADQTVDSSQTTNSVNTSVNAQATQSTFEPQEVSQPAADTSTQAGTDSDYIEINNQGYVAPKTTLDNYLTSSNEDQDNTNNASDTDTYEDNSQYEAIYNHVKSKATNATADEVGQIVKDLPSMWNYIGQNDTDSDTQGQVWKFHTTLSNGRDAFVTIDGTAQPDSTDALQQQMPALLRSMGQSIEPGALNQAVDIDALKKSSIYQDYVDGKYTGPTSNNAANTSDAISAIENHTTISLDKPNNGAEINQLPNVANVDPNVLLKNAEENAKNTDSTATSTTSDNDSTATYDAIKNATYSKMSPWASDDEKAEMLKSVPSIWNDISTKTNKDDKSGQLFNYVLNGTDGRQIYYTVDGRIVPSGNKYEKQLPSVLNSVGKDMTKGEFDAAVNNDILRNSQAYQDYQQKSQGNAATTTATTAATAAASPLGGLGIAPLLLGGLLPVIGLPLVLGGLALAVPATAIVLGSLPIVGLLAAPVLAPIALALPVILGLPIILPTLALGIPLLLGTKLLTLPIRLFNNLVFSTIGAVVLTAPIRLLNTLIGAGLGLINTLLGSIPLAVIDFVAPIILNFAIVSLISQFIQLTTFNLLLLATITKALINGAIDLALALSFIGLPLALLKGLFDLVRLGLGLLNSFLLPILAGALTFFALLPIALLNTLLLTIFNISIPLILSFIVSLVLSTLVGGLTFLGLLGLKVLNDLLRNGLKLIIGLIAAATIFIGLPLLIVAAQVLNFFLLLVANAVGGLIIWNLLTLAKALMLAGLGIALFSLPLLGQLAINTLVKWSIRALIHIFRFFVGLFKVGARLVLSFVLGLLNAIAGLAKAASVITAVVSGIAAALTALIPVVGPVLALLPLLISLLSIANSLILTPIKFVLGLLNLLVLGLNLLAIPLYLFVRPLISIALALGAGLLSDLLMPVLTLPLVLFNQLTLFNLVFLPLLLLSLFNTFIVLPLVLGLIGLSWAFGLPLILALGAFGLVAILGLLLLSTQLPLVALALLALPSFIPFFNLIMDTIFFAPLMITLISILNLFIGLPLMMLIDSIINLVVPFLVWLAGMLLLAPIFGPLAFLNPLTWLNLPLISLIGTFLTKLALKLISLPLIFMLNGLLSLIPAAIVAFIVGLLRALFGGLPFLLLAPLFLLPIILNGLLTALIPGLNLFTVPAALTALFLGLPLVLMGLLNNLAQKALLRVVMFVLTYLASNVLKDLLALFGVPLLIDLLTPLLFILKLLSTQFLIFPALWLGLPLLAQAITSALLWGWTFIKGFAQVALDVFNIGATLLTLPLWTILPAINLLRRLALVFVALVSLPLRLLKNVFDLIRAFVEIGFILLIPILVGLPAFLLLLPITTFNFFALKLLNMLLPLLAALIVSIGLSLLVAGITFIVLLGLHLLNNFLRLAARLLLLGAIALLFLVALPILLGAAVLNFLLLAGLNFFVGFLIWLGLTLLNNVLALGFLLGLLLLPLIGQLVINTIVKWSIRAVIHLIRFFVGLFRLGARLVLQFIIGLTNLVLGVAKAVAAIAAVANLLLAPISLLVPVVGPVLALLHLLRALLAGINFLILLPLKLLAGLLNLLTLGGLLLSIPYWLFIRPLTSVLLAIGAGILSDIAMTLLTLPLVLFNTLTIFNFVVLPALLLKAFNNLVLLPLIINGIGLILAIGLPLALLLGALGLLNLLGLGLLGLKFPLIALILLALPGLIPFLNLNLAILNLVGLAALLLNGLKLLLLPLKILKDLINDLLLPLLLAGLTFLLLLPLLGVISFLNPLRWLNLAILSAIGTFLLKLLLGLILLPLILIKNLITSLIPAALAGLLVGLLRALFGGLPFLLLALGLLLPLILNGLLTFLIPGLNLLTVPLGLLALLLGLPLVALGILNNLLKQLVWTIIGTILSYLALNLAKDLLDLLLWLPLQLLLALPLFLLNLALNAFILRPLLLFGLPLLAALLTNLALVAFNLIRRALELLAELLTLGATLLLSPLTLGLPLLNLLRRILKFLVALRLIHNLIHQILDLIFLVGLPILNAFLGLPLSLLAGLTVFNLLLALNSLILPFLLSLINTVIAEGIIGLLLIPLQILNNFLLSLIPAAIIGLINGLLRLLLGGLPFFTLMRLFVILPLAINGLLTALIPGLNLLTVPLGLLALLVLLPLSIIGTIFNIIDALLMGNLSRLISKLVLNVLNDLISLFNVVLAPLLLLAAGVLGPLLLLLLAAALVLLPLILSLIVGAIAIAISMLNLLPISLPIILLASLLAIPLFLFGIVISLELIWFFAPIVLQFLVNPIADIMGFVVMSYTAVTDPIFYLGLWFINIPLTLFFFVGSMVNWLNPLNLLFHVLAGIGFVGLITIRALAVLDILSLQLIDALSLNPLSWLAGLFLGIGLLLTQGLWVLLTLSALNIVAIPLVINLVIWLIVGFISIFAIAFTSGGMGGILNPAVWGMWIYIVMAPVESLLLILLQIAVMILVDIAKVIVGLPFIVINLIIGLTLTILTHLLNPLVWINGILGFATIGLSSIAVSVLGFFMLAEEWLPFSFNIIAFLWYLVFENPAWFVLALSTNFPLIGWITLAIGGIVFWLVGMYGAGALTALGFENFIVISMALFYNLVFGFALLGAILPVLLLVLPLAIIGSLILMLLISLPVLLLNLLVFVPGFIFGLFTTGVMIWFLAPIILQLLVNPIADIVAFIILVFTALTHPIFYFGIGLITIPLSVLTFLGSFINWGNPLNLLFHAIAFAAIVQLLFIGFNVVLIIDLLQLVNFFNIPAFWLLEAAKLLLFGLWISMELSVVNLVIIPQALNLFIWVVVGLITIFLAAFMAIGFGGIFSPANIGMWMYIVFAPVQVIFFLLFEISAMLVLNTIKMVVVLPLVIGILQMAILASIIGNLINPIGWIANIIAILALATLGVSSLFAALAGLFMLAELWLPLTFNIIPFVWYLAFENPVWYVIISGAVFPVIGWIPELFGIGYWLVGMWGAGFLTDLSFQIFIGIFMGIFNLTIFGLAALGSVLPLLLLVLIPAVIGSFLLMNGIFLPFFLGGLLLLIPGIIITIVSVIVISWIFAPILTVLAVNPIADMVGFVIMVYTASTDPFQFFAFWFINIPLMFAFFVGSFLNWLNPFNILVHIITGTTIIGLLAIRVLSAVSILTLQLIDFLGFINPFSFFAGIILGAALIGLNLVWLQIVLNALNLVAIPMVINLIIWLAIGLISIFLLEVASVGFGGILNPGVIGMWVYLALAPIQVVFFMIGNISIMLLADLLLAVVTLPLIVGALQIGLLLTMINHFLNPLAWIAGVLGFASIGLSSIAMGILGIFTFGSIWLPATFGLIPFLWYLVFENPAWFVLALASNFPLIGWITLAIGGIIFWLIGGYGVGALTALSFENFIVIYMGLLGYVIYGFAMLAAILPVLLLVLPLALLGAVAILALAAIPSIIFNLLVFLIPTIIGIVALGVLLWFIAPIFLQLAVNPLADAVSFIVLIFTAVTDPVFYYGFAFITMPWTLASLLGLFVNWANPLNIIFHVIATLAAVSLVAIKLGVLINIDLLELINFLNVPVFWSLIIAKLLLRGLWISMELGVLNIVVIPQAINLIIWVIVGLITIFLDALMSIGFGGVLNPANIGMWIYIFFAPIQVVYFLLFEVAIMLLVNLVKMVVVLPLIIGLLQFSIFGSIVGNLLNPLAWILTPIILITITALGLSSILAAILGLFMLAEFWLPVSFNIFAFIWYLAFENPVWFVIISGALFPVIGWIPELFGIGYWLVGMWGAGFLTDIGFQIFMLLFMGIFNSFVFGLAALGSVFPVLLLTLIPGLIGSLLFWAALLIPLAIIGLLVYIPMLIFGVIGAIILYWLFAPIVLQFLTNPVADIVGLIVMVYTQITDPLQYFLFGFINIPLNVIFFFGSFLNWINPLNLVFTIIDAFAIIGGPLQLIMTLVLLAFIAISSYFLPFGFNFGAGLIASFSAIAIQLLIINAFILMAFVLPIFVTFNLGVNLIIWLAIGLISIFLLAVASVGFGSILNPGVIGMWVYLALAPIQVVVLTFFNMMLMLNADFIVFIITAGLIALLFIPMMLGSLLAHPLLFPIILLALNIIGITSIGTTFAAMFAFAHLWLPLTFNILAFLQYLIFENPLWFVVALGAMFPVVGWIPLAIGGIIFWLLGGYGAGLLTALGFQFLVMRGLWPILVSSLASLLILSPLLFLLLPLIGLIAIPLISAVLLGNFLLILALLLIPILALLIPLALLALATIPLILPFLLLAVLPLTLLLLPALLLPALLLAALPLLALLIPLQIAGNLLRRLINGLIALGIGLLFTIATNLIGPVLVDAFKLLRMFNLTVLHLLSGLGNLIPGLLHKLITLPLWLLTGLQLLPSLLSIPLILLNQLISFIASLVWNVLGALIGYMIAHFIIKWLNRLLKLLGLLLLALPLFLLLNGINLLALPITKLLLPAIAGIVTGLLVLNSPLLGLLVGIPLTLLRGLQALIDLIPLVLLGLPGLLPFHNLIMDALFLLPLLLNLIALFNLLRTPLKWIHDLFWQLALPLLVQVLTFLALIPFFGLISLLNPFKWLRMALLSALTTFNVQLLSTLILLPLKLLNNKILSLLPALLNGLLLGFLRGLLGGLPLDILGLLALPLLNILGLIGTLTPGLRLLGLPLLLLTQLLGLPLLLDTLRNLIAPLLWGALAGLLTYPIAKLIKNLIDIALLPLLGLLSTLPIFLLKLFNKAFVLRPLLLFGLPLLAGLIAAPLVALFNLIRRAIKLGLNLLNGAIALLTMPIWLGLPALNLLRRALILPVLLLTLLRGLRNILRLLGFPLLLLALPLLAGLATLLLALPLLGLLNMLLSMPLLALPLALLAALPILPLKILADLLLLPLVFIGSHLLGLIPALIAGLLLPLILGRLFRHLIKLPFDLLKLAGLVLFNLLLPFIPFLNLLTPLLWPLGLLLQPLALADVLRDLFGNLPFDLLNLLLLPLITLLAGLALLIPGLGLLLAPILLPLILFNLLIAMPLTLLRLLGDLAKALLLGLPLALLGTLLALPIINIINDVLSLLLLPLLSGLLTLPLFLLNLGLLTLLAFPIAKGVLPFLIANGLSALIANFLPVLIGLLLNPVIVLANLFRLLKDLIKTINKFILLGLLALPGLIPFLDLLLDGLFLIPALINGLSLLNLLTMPLRFLKDLIKNNVLPLLLAGLLNLLLLPIFGPLQFLNPINWILVPAIAALRTFNTKLLAKLLLVPGLILLNLLTSLIPATIAAILVPLLRGLLGGLPLDILGLLGLPLLNLLALLGTLIPGVRLLAFPLLLLTQLLGLPLLLDTLRNLIAPLLWGALAGLLTYPIANLVKDALALLGLPLFDLLTFLPIFLFKLVKNVILGNLLHLGLPLLAQALTFLALLGINLLRAGLKFLRNVIPLALALLTLPLWFNLPLLNILRRVAFWALLGLDLLTLPFKLLRNLLRLAGLPLLLLGLPLLAGLLNFLFILPLVTLAMMLLALPLPLTLLLPLLALLGNLPIKLLADLLLLPLMLLGNALLALPLALLLGNLIPLILGALNGLIKLPLDLLGLLGLPLLLGLLDLGKLIALLNPLLWPLLPIINVLRNILRMLLPFKLADVLKDILGPLSALPIDGLLALAIPALGLLTLLTMLNPLFWPLLPVLLPLALTLGLVGTPIALLRVLKDLLKLALPVLLAMLLFPIIHTGLNILGLLALPLISGLLTLPLFLLNLGLKTLITLPLVKAILPILINLGLLIPLTILPALLLAPLFLLPNLVKGLRLIGDILATLLALPGVLKDLFDLAILPLKILIKPLLVFGLPIVAKVLTFLALLPLMLLNNLLAHLIKLPLLGLITLGNALLPVLIPSLLMNLLARPLLTLGLMLLNGVILPALLKLAIAIPLLGLLILPLLIGLLALPLFLLSLPIPLLNMGLQLLSLGMIIPGLGLILGGLIALPVGLINLLGGIGGGTPGVTIPGTPGTPGEGNETPEIGNIIRRIPSAGFWVHNDPLVLD